MNKHFIDKIKEVIKEHTGLNNATVQVPKDESFGHFTTTAALQLKGEQQDMHSKAVVIKEAVKTLGFIGRIDISNNGFVNMWIDNNYFISNWHNVYKDILSCNINFENKGDSLEESVLYNINYCYSRIQSILRVLSHQKIYPGAVDIDESSITNKDLQLLQMLWNISLKAKEDLGLSYQDIIGIVSAAYDYLPCIMHKNNDNNISFRLSMISSIAHIIKFWSESCNIEIEERM